MAKLVEALLSVLVHILPADCHWRSCGRRCCLFGSYLARRLPIAKMVVAQLSILVHILPTDCQWRSACPFGSYFARRLPIAKLVAALFSILVQILHAGCLLQSCCRRCFLCCFIFCPSAGGGAAVCFVSWRRW
jgi:hypothetical protein